MIDNRYVQLEYLESSGTQYIDTGLTGATHNSVIAKFSAQNPTATRNYVWGWGTTAGGRSQFSYSNPAFCGFGTNYTNTLSLAVDKNVHTIEMKDKKFTLDGNLIWTSNTNWFSSTQGFVALFACWIEAGGLQNLSSGLRIYEWKAYKDDVLVRHLVPAKRKSDNVLGMFDKVNNVFYTNAGTGSFIGGKEIKDTLKSRIVPHAYIQTEYLESTGTQYIDTGLKGNLNTAVEIKFEGITPSTNDILNIFGDITTSTIALSCNTGFNNTTAQPTSRFGNKATGAVVQNLSKNTPYIITSNKNTYIIKNQDGTVYRSYSFGTTTAFTTTNNLWMFVCNNNNAPSTYTGGSKFYYCKMWDNDVLVRDFIPVVRKIDNVAGMYDLVEGKFYTNAGTGSFIAGDEILTADKVIIKEKTYQLLDYIQSSGTQYIDTGWQPSSKVLAVEFKVNCVSSMATASICGSEDKSFSGARWLFTLYGQNDAWRQYPLIGTWNNGRNSGYHISTPQNTDVVARIDYNDGTTTCTSSQGDNWTHTQSGDNITDHKQNLNLFQNADTQRSSIKMYSYKIWDNNTLVRNFIPARRLSDNEVGMLDMVEGKFYGNVSGQGAFIGSDNKYDGYEFYDYIEGSGTQYIDTGIAPNGNNTGFDIVYSYTAPRNYETAIGVLTKAGVGYFGLATSTTQVYRYWGNGDAKTTSVVANKKYHVTENYMNDKKFIWDDGVLTWDLSDSTTIATGNIWLFNFNPGSYTGKQPLYGRIYSCKISDGTTLVRNFVPAKRKSDNTVGMLDMVNNIFYANQGTGIFTAGNKVPAPDGYYEPKEVQELRLPYNGNKYKFFDYIESSGTQWIDTGKKAPDNTDIEVRFSLTSMDDGASNNSAIFGGRNGTTSKTCTFFYLASVKPHYFRFDRQGQIQIANATQIRHQAGDIYKFSYHNNRDTEFINETTDETYTYTIAPLQTFTDHNISLFGVNTSGTVGTFMRGRIYGWKYWENGELLQDFLPAQRLSDNAIGMFDKITNTFFENKGTGVFIAGNEIVSIPNEYERLEYLQTDGESWIDTGMIGDLNTSFQIKAQAVNINRQEVLFGSRASATSRVMSVIFPANTDLKACAVDFGNYTQTRIIPTNFNANSVLEIYNSKDYRYVKDLTTGTITEATTTYTTSFTTPTNLYIAYKTSGFVSGQHFNFKGKIFYCKIWENNVLVRNLFPVRRKSDNVLGMLDIVNNVFYTNKGTGSFTASTNTMPNKVMMPFWKRYPDVPSQYEVKEYLESDGYAQIDSGIRFTQGDKIDMVGRFIDPKHDDGLICMTPWNQGNSSRFMFACATTGGTPSFCMSYGTLAGGSNKVIPYFTPDTEYHRWTYEDLTLTIDDGVASLTNTDVYPDDSRITGSVYLFRRFNGGCAVAIKYYNHWRNGQLIASYVPVMRKSDGTLGLYDVTTDKFLENVGTGSFTTNT